MTADDETLMPFFYVGFLQLLSQQTPEQLCNCMNLAIKKSGDSPTLLENRHQWKSWSVKRPKLIQAWKNGKRKLGWFLISATEQRCNIKVSIQVVDSLRPFCAWFFLGCQKRTCPRTTKITLDGMLREKITIMLKVKKKSKPF